ncbi:peptidoglycan-binding protein [Kribbella sp. NPDC051770]|uniref:peptidoglycan-binding protein n=1 Tax=Kribbella sp. NPDC051770 TaxID=3155413 RepID=UPI00342079B4
MSTLGTPPADAPRRAGSPGRGRSRRAVALALGAVLVAGAGYAGFRVFDKPPPAVAADGPDPAETVAIQRTDLSQARELSGDLGYGGRKTVKTRATGTITWLPKPGTTVDRGDVLLRVDDKPVVLFYGSTPLFRTLGTPPAKKTPPPDDNPADPPNSPPDSPAKSPSGPPPNTPADPPAKPPAGPDVKVVKQNLAALGFLGTTGSDKLTPATTKAIKQWQKSLDLDQTGVLDPASVVVLPNAVRIDSIAVALGDPAPADVFGVTSTEKVVTLPLDADDTAGVQAGVKVKLTLPNGKATTGTVRAVSTDAAPPPSDGNPADGTKKPQVTATIALDQQSAASGIDSGPTTVTVPGAVRKGVLVVPVAALLALREGGYAVQVVDGTATSLVGVKTGMFAAGNVEITGTGLQAGQKVVTTS